MRTLPADQLGRGESTRERLLDLAERAILEKGYAATSIEELIAAAGITKSGFFYHFREKSDLAKALMRRDNANTSQAFDAIFGQADADTPIRSTRCSTASASSQRPLRSRRTLIPAASSPRSPTSGRCSTRNIGN
jgi:AcrR family transcriptional regulator